MKQVVQTNVASTCIVELQHLTSKIEGEFWTNYGDKANMKGDDELEDNNGNVHEEAPNDLDIRIQQPLGIDSSTLRRLGRLC